MLSEKKRQCWTGGAVSMQNLSNMQSQACCCCSSLILHPPAPFRVLFLACYHNTLNYITNRNQRVSFFCCVVTQTRDKRADHKHPTEIKIPSGLKTPKQPSLFGIPERPFFFFAIRLVLLISKRRQKPISIFNKQMQDWMEASF